MDWSAAELSESRLPLIIPQASCPQLIYKGGIFQTWKKKTAVALNRGFFETLPKLKQVTQSRPKWHG